MIYIGLVATVISISLAVFGTYRFIDTRRHIARYRWENFNRELSNPGTQMQTSDELSSKDIFSSERSTGFISSTKVYKSLEKKLAQGDIYLHPGEYILMVSFWGIILGGALFFILRTWLMFVLGFIMVILLSNMYLVSSRHKKIRALNNQIVDMLALVSNGLKAGYSFFQTIGIVARDMQPPMSQEFKRMLKQINMGSNVEDALRELTLRVESPDLDLVVTAILIQRQVGGNLSEVLDNISYTIRERIMLKNQVKVLTSQGRLSGIIISLLTPVLAVIIYLLNPDFMIVMIKEPLGIMMIVIAVVLQILGVILIRKIVNIDI